MQKLGEQLKAEREKKGVSLHEVGMALKINPKILKAIEEADKPNLPAKTFLIGFLKSYAQYLKLNPSQILSQYYSETETKSGPAVVEQAHVAAHPETGKPAEKTKEEKNKPIESRKNEGKKILSIIVSLVLVGVIVVVAKLVDKYQKESRLVEISDAKPIDATPEVPIVEPPELPLQTSPAPQETLSTPISSTGSSTPVITAATAEVKPPDPKPVEVTPPAEVKPPEPKPIERKPEEPKVVEQKPAAVAPPKETKPIVKPTEIILEALNKVDVRFSFDNQKFESLTMAADEIHTFKSKSQLILEISDGGSVNIIVNGRDRGVPGTLGKPLKLSYPK